MLKKLTLALVLALVFAGVAAAETRPIDQNYEGPYWIVSEDIENGTTSYKSAQSASGTFPQTNADLQAISIEWTEDRTGHITGSAVFMSVTNLGTVAALLDGISPMPEPGQEYRTASVNVTFNGGTGEYEGATGSAYVEAQLTLDGVSTGHIGGEIVLP